MCGLAGVVGDIDKDINDLFKELLYLTALRGSHSTGVASVSMNRRGSQVRVDKSPDSADYWLWADTKKQTPIISGVMNDILIGHCRHATVGDINIANSHPFDLKTLVGCHNGTLVDSRYVDDKKTDSELMFQDIEERGVEEVLKGLSSYSAYAIAMHEKGSRVLTLARNVHRPLWIAQLHEKDTILWSSEERMLDFVLNGKKKIPASIKYLESDWIYNINIDDIDRNNETPWDVIELPKKEAWGDDWWEAYGGSGYWSQEPRIDAANNSNTKDLFDKAPWDFECNHCGTTIGIHDVQDCKVEIDGGSTSYYCVPCQNVLGFSIRDGNIEGEVHVG